MLHDLDWCDLKDRRWDIRLVLLYKIVTGHVAINLLYWTVLKIMDAGYCLYVHIFVFFSHLNRLILTTLINSCQTSGFSKVGTIIKYNIMHFPVLIKTVFKLVYIICKKYIIR